jgi:hypothetical protein
MLMLVKLPPPLPRDQQSTMLDDLRDGWRYFRSTTWLWVVVLAFSVLNALHAGAFFTLGPALPAVGPLGAVFGLRETILVSGLVYCVICLATLGSRSVRELPRAPVTPTSRPGP